jgi:hypothetical protein
MSIVSFLAQASPYYAHTTATMNEAEWAATMGMTLFAITFVFTIVATVYVITALLLSRIFKKAGIEGWKAWVPIYNNWILLELGGQKGFWAVLTLIPFVNVVSAVFMIIAMYHIGLKFGKEGAFVLLAIFVPLVWYIWLAVDDSKWKGPRPKNAVPVSKKSDVHTP